MVTTKKPAVAPKNTGRFGPGNPGKPAGAVNRTTAALKDAIVAAATQVGEDGNGKGGLTGYLVMLARREPVAFCGLLGKVLPLTLSGDLDKPVRLEFAWKAS